MRLILFELIEFDWIWCELFSELGLIILFTSQVDRAEVGLVGNLVAPTVTVNKISHNGFYKSKGGSEGGGQGGSVSPHYGDA